MSRRKKIWLKNEDRYIYRSHLDAWLARNERDRFDEPIENTYNRCRKFSHQYNNYDEDMFLIRFNQRFKPYNGIQQCKLLRVDYNYSNTPENLIVRIATGPWKGVVAVAYLTRGDYLIAKRKS